MNYSISITTIISMLLILASCNSQQIIKEQITTATEEQKEAAPQKQERHRYGGWYCPDNFGFAPVDIQKLDEVPAIAHRLPTEQELHDHMSLIKVDTSIYPDARALDMELPRLARIYDQRKGMSELIIVIQAIEVQGDSVVGYRFPNGGNGSAWLNDVTFLSEEEVAGMGAQPFFYSTSVLRATSADIWKALCKTDYFQELIDKFDKKDFFTSTWDAHSMARLEFDEGSEKASGYVGMVYGNLYLHIDYNRDGFHYSEKMLIIENKENNTSEFFFASGPYPKDFAKQKLKWDKWVEEVKKGSEVD